VENVIECVLLHGTDWGDWLDPAAGENIPRPDKASDTGRSLDW
jgi:hypothetical protein